MILCKVIPAIFLATALGMAQTVTIRGVVKDTIDAAIPGATVRLEVANISTMTGSDGRFTLTNVSKLMQQQVNSGMVSTSSIQLQRGKIAIRLSGIAPVAIQIHDVGGRLLYNSWQTYGSGTHVLQVPVQSPGICLCKVTIGKEVYVFKSSPSGTFSAAHNAVVRCSSTSAKQARAVAEIADIIFVFKEGQINYRASIGTYDTNGIVIRMIPNAGNVTDVDGNVYQSVRIGKQIWTVENLRTTKYKDGTPIQLVTDPGVDGGTTGWRNIKTGAYCYYDNDAKNKPKYGAMYNWYAVNTGNLAPKDWHIPTDAEWDTLQNYLIANGYNWDETKIGNKIGKSLAAKTDWFSYNQTGTIGDDLSKNNSSGFSTLPGGSRGWDGGFGGKRYGSDWWSATEVNVDNAWRRTLLYGIEHLSKNEFNKRCGIYVRLLRD